MNCKKTIIVEERNGNHVEIYSLESPEDYIRLANTIIHSEHEDLKNRSYIKKSPYEFDVDSQLDELGYFSDIENNEDLNSLKETVDNIHTVASRYFDTPEYYVPLKYDDYTHKSYPETKATKQKYEHLHDYHSEGMLVERYFEWLEAKNKDVVYTNSYEFSNDDEYKECLKNIVADYDGKNKSALMNAVKSLSKAETNDREI